MAIRRLSIALISCVSLIAGAALASAAIGLAWVGLGPAPDVRWTKPGAYLPRARFSPFSAPRALRVG